MVEKDKELGLFQQKLCKIKLDIRVSCFDIFDKYLLFGDDKGYIFCYEMNETTNECAIDHSIDLAKGKVDQLKCHSILNIAFVLIAGTLHIITIPKLEKIYKTEIKDIHKFCLNSYHSKPNLVMIINKSKRMKFFDYSQEMRKLIDSKTIDEMRCSDLPDLVEWYNHWIIMVTKKKCVLNSTDGQHFKMDYEITYGKNVNGAWLIYTNSIGIFMEKNIPKQQNTIDFGNKPLVCINAFKNFVISLHDSQLKVFDGSDSSNIQDVNFPHGSVGRFLAIGNKYVLYLLQNFSNMNNAEMSFQLYILKELAFNKQIDKLLSEEKYEDALGILNNNILSTDEDKPKKLEQFFLDAAWVLLKKGEFRKAMQHFKLANFDPLALIYLFVNDLRINVEDKALLAHINKFNCSIERIAKNNIEMIKDALYMVYHLLQDKRNYFLTSYKDIFYGGSLENALRSNQKLSFMQSDQALITMDGFEKTLKQNLEIINTTIVKIMVKNNDLKLSHQKEIINSEHFYWNKDDLESFLTSSDNTEKAKLTMAYLHEKNEKWESALSIWQDFGQKRDSAPEYSLEAKERTKTILTQAKDKDLFKEYIQWMIIKYPDDAFKLFLSSEIIQVEYFYTSIVGNIDKSNPNLSIKEKFLEFYIKNGCMNERYYTMLCELYIEKLFKMKKSSSDYETGQLEGNLKIYYDKLSNILTTTSLYDKVHILDKLKDTWMIELEIYLYSTLGQHIQAIQKLIMVGASEDNFEKVEKYCNETKTSGSSLLGEMFKIICVDYDRFYKTLATCRTDKDRQSVERTVQVYKNQILNVLKKYGDNPKLDVFLVLQHIPGDWLLSEQILYEYLVKVIKNSNHMSNKYKIARSLSEISLLYKEKEVIEARNKSVTIGNDTNCELCKKRIGSTLFVVYPNMKIYHTKCAQNLSICPVTRTDFTKKQTLNI